MKISQTIGLFLIAAIVGVSCTKYQEIVEAEYPGQTLYMPAAVDPNSTNGIYMINSVATPGLAYRYVADVPGRKLHVPLAVYRSGVSASGSLSTALTTNTDTVMKLVASGKLPAGTQVLPADKFSLPTSITLADGVSAESFNVTIDLNFLLANLTSKFAIGVGISNNEKAAGKHTTTVALIDPAFLVPTANFTRTISGRTVTFANTSSNGVSYVWDYGDGTPVSTEKAAPHTYASAGTYTVSLIAVGALGDLNKATYTSSVVIP